MGRKAEVQRALLEKLMGPEGEFSGAAQRWALLFNISCILVLVFVAMGLTTQQLHFTDEKVCKNFLCGVCPHDLFSNTVSNIKHF